MNTLAQSNGAKRILVLMVAAGALTFSACGSESEPTEAAPLVEDTAGWSFSPYPHRTEPPTDTPHDGESVRAPRAMGGDPTVPTV